MITAVYNRSSPCCGELKRVSRSGDDGVVSEGGVDVDVEGVDVDIEDVDVDIEDVDVEC